MGTVTEQARHILDIIIRDVIERRIRGDLFGDHDTISYSDLSSNCLEDFESYGSFEGDDFRVGVVLDAPSQHDYMNENTPHRKQAVKFQVLNYKKGKLTYDHCTLHCLKY